MLPYPRRGAGESAARRDPRPEGWLSLTRDSELTLRDRQALGNVVRGPQQVIDSPTATRVSERVTTGPGATECEMSVKDGSRPGRNGGTPRSRCRARPPGCVRSPGTDVSPSNRGGRVSASLASGHLTASCPGTSPLAICWALKGLARFPLGKV